MWMPQNVPFLRDKKKKRLPHSLSQAEYPCSQALPNFFIPCSSDVKSMLILHMHNIFKT